MILSTQVLNGEISKLVQEKHDLIAAVKTGEDKYEALGAECDYLRVQLAALGGATTPSDINTAEPQSGKPQCECAGWVGSGRAGWVGAVGWGGVGLAQVRTLLCQV